MSTRSDVRRVDEHQFVLSTDFLAGFLEAEASFGVIPNNARSSPSWTCCMALSVREDDAGLLEQCRRSFGIGTVDRRRARGFARPQARWVVRRKADVARLAGLLGGRFRGRNAPVLANWLEAVDFWTAQSYGTPEAVHRELARLASRIKQLRPYLGDRGNAARFPLSSGYLGGLITGEGSFTFATERPRFLIHMRADETRLLTAVAAEAGVGSLHQQPAYKSSAPSVTWCVHRPREMATLVRWLNGLELAGRKLDQFTAWQPEAMRVAHAAAIARCEAP